MGLFFVICIRGTPGVKGRIATGVFIRRRRFTDTRVIGIGTRRQANKQKTEYQPFQFNHLMDSTDFLPITSIALSH